MIPRRLDRLPWSRWHWLIVAGLGITWILDGFEVTLVGALASVLTNRDTLHLSTQQASSLGTWYLLGAVGGALFFGYLTDRLGRKKLFMVTLGVYLVFTTLIVPALATYRHTLSRQLGLGYLLALVSYVIGLGLSVVTDLPSSPVIVWAMAVIGTFLHLTANGKAVREQHAARKPNAATTVPRDAIPD